MIIRMLGFFVCASILGTEVHAKAFDRDRYDREVAAIPSGLSMYDGDGKIVTLTSKLGSPCIAKTKCSENILSSKVTFELYTNQRPNEPKQLKINNASSLRKSGFNSSKPTYMITHGWRNDRNTYLANTDSNVIVVDWSAMSMFLDYIVVTYEVARVGKRVREIIAWLYGNGLKADGVTLIGHSLGAHVMGIAGYKLSHKVNNIVALPMFNFARNSECLTIEDAKHVQIIHTNGGGAGYLFANGHSDFFPNGGSIQPGCPDTIEMPACCHARAIDYFAESISNSFVGIACNSQDDFENGNCGTDPQYATMGGLNLSSVTPGRIPYRQSSQQPEP